MMRVEMGRRRSYVGLGTVYRSGPNQCDIGVARWGTHMGGDTLRGYLVGFQRHIGSVKNGVITPTLKSPLLTN